MKQAGELVAANGGLAEDVQIYLPCAVKACSNGVKRAHLISRHVDGALLIELFTHHGIGTMVVPESPEVIRDATRRGHRRASCRSSSPSSSRASWCGASATSSRARSSASS